MKANEAIVAEIGSNRSKTYLEPCMICLSLVWNRGKPIEGAGEGEPITSAIDMRDSAKAPKEAWLGLLRRDLADASCRSRHSTRLAAPPGIAPGGSCSGSGIGWLFIRGYRLGNPGHDLVCDSSERLV